VALTVGLVGGYLLLLGGTFATLLSDPDLMLLTALGITVVGIMAGRRLLSREAVPPVALWLSLAIVWALISVLLGTYPRGSVEEVCRLGWSLAALSAGLVLGGVPERRQAALVGCLLAVAPVGWLAFTEAIGRRAPVVHYLTEFGQARAAATLNHPNNLAGFIALAAPLALGATMALAERRDRRAILSGLLVVMLLAGAAATYSKGGQLAVLAALAIWLSQLPSGGLRSWLAGDRRRGRLLLVVGIPLLLTAMVGFWFSPFGERVRLFWELIPTLPKFERWGTWQAAARMVADHPLRGVGPGCFGLAMPAYKTAASHAQLFTHAHNWYLHLAAEQGVVGLVLWLGCLLSGLDSLQRRLRTETDPAARRWLQGLLAGQVGFMVAGLLDYNVGVPCIALAFWFAVGLGAAGDPVGGRGQWEHGGLALGAGLAAAMMLPWLAFNRGQAAYGEVCRAVAMGRLTEAAAALEVARVWDPSQRCYDLVRADLAAWSGRWDVCGTLLKEQAARPRPPLDSFYLDRLAWLSLADGDAAGARSWLEQAIARDASEPSLRVDLGMVTMATAPDVAREAFETAARQSPDSIGSEAGLGMMAYDARRLHQAAETWSKGSLVGNPRDRPPRFLIAYGCRDPAYFLPVSQAAPSGGGRVRYHGAAVPRLRLLALELAALARKPQDSSSLAQEPAGAAAKP